MLAERLVEGGRSQALSRCSPQAPKGLAGPLRELRLNPVQRVKSTDLDILNSEQRHCWQFELARGTFQGAGDK